MCPDMCHVSAYFETSSLGVCELTKGVHPNLYDFRVVMLPEHLFETRGLDPAQKTTKALSHQRSYVYESICTCMMCEWLTLVPDLDSGHHTTGRD